MKNILIIVLLFIGSKAIAQEYNLSIQGQIFDDSYGLIPEVVISFNKTKSKIYLDNSGTYKFKYKYQKE